MIYYPDMVIQESNSFLFIKIKKDIEMLPI